MAELRRINGLARELYGPDTSSGPGPDRWPHLPDLQTTPRANERERANARRVPDVRSFSVVAGTLPVVGVRPNGEGEGDESPSRSHRANLCLRFSVRVRVALLEVRDRLLRLIVREYPSRTLRLRRTRERLAEICANDLPGDSERGCDLFGAIRASVRLLCHFPSLRAFVDHGRSVAYVRSFASQDMLRFDHLTFDRSYDTRTRRIRSFVNHCHRQSLTTTTIPLPRREGGIWIRNRTRGAKRVGPGIFGHIAATQGVS